jgi:hypothetical protein
MLKSSLPGVNELRSLAGGAANTPSPKQRRPRTPVVIVALPASVEFGVKRTLSMFETGVPKVDSVPTPILNIRASTNCQTSSLSWFPSKSKRRYRHLFLFRLEVLYPRLTTTSFTPSRTIALSIFLSQPCDSLSDDTL